MRQFFSRLAAALQPESSTALEIVQEDDRWLTIRGHEALLTLDRQEKLLVRNEKPVASFEEIEFVTIGRDTESVPTEWSVAIALRGRSWGMVVGHTTDDVQASIVAARIGRWTGKPVQR